MATYYVPGLLVGAGVAEMTQEFMHSLVEDRHIQGHHGIRTIGEACTRSRGAQQREGLMSSVKERVRDPGSLALKKGHPYWVLQDE